MPDTENRVPPFCTMSDHHRLEAEVERLRTGLDQIVGDIRDATEWSAQERWRVMNRLDDLLHPSEEKDS